MPSILKNLTTPRSIPFTSEIKTWVAVSMGIILMLVAGILHKSYQELLHFILVSSGPYVSSNAWFLVSLTIIPFAIAIHRKWTRQPLPTSQISISIQVLTGMCAGIVFFGLFLLFMHFQTKDVQATYFRNISEFAEFVRNARLFDLLAFYVAIDVLRPVFEEIVFRGFIFQSIAKRYGLIIGLVISSLGFLAIHIGLVNSPIMMFLFGAISCLFVYFFRGLAASYSMHITYNSLITMSGIIRGA